MKFPRLPVALSLAIVMSSAAAAPSHDNSPQLAYGLMMKQGGKLVFAPCRDPSYAFVEDVSDDGQVVRGLDQVGLAAGKQLYVELLGWLDGGTLRAKSINLARTDGRCQRPGSNGEAWLASGHGPDWAMAAGTAGIQLQRAGVPELSIPYSAFREAGTVSTFSSEGEYGKLEISLTKALCRDQAAATIAGWTATIAVDGQILKGCAWQR